MFLLNNPQNIYRQLHILSYYRLWFLLRSELRLTLVPLFKTVSILFPAYSGERSLKLSVVIISLYNSNFV